MTHDLLTGLSGQLLEEEVELTLNELCHVCHIDHEQVFELVEYGLIEPRGTGPRSWRFHGICVQRIHSAQRLNRDLGVNMAGATLALELLDEIKLLRARLARLDR